MEDMSRRNGEGARLRWKWRKKDRKKMKEPRFLNLNFLSSRFFILFLLTLWLNIWNNTSALCATSHVATSFSVCHIHVFVTDDGDCRDLNQNVYDL